MSDNNLELALQEQTDYLDQLAVCIQSLPLQVYVGDGVSPQPQAVGPHVRHLLDHYQALLQLEYDQVDYEKRRRMSDLERDPGLALDEIRRIRKELAQLPKQASAQVQGMIRKSPSGLFKARNDKDQWTRLHSLSIQALS